MVPPYTTSATVELWDPRSSTREDDLRSLAAVLHACVHAGASVSFVLPFSIEEAERYWREQVVPILELGQRCLLVARVNGQICGTVQLLLNTPPNQPHRAEVAKLLVHPEARRQGLARRLMLALEELAATHQRMLLTLDTRTGDAAEPLYLSLGYQVAGIIPDYARAPESSRL